MSMINSPFIYYLALIPLILKYDDKKPFSLLYRIYIGIITISVSMYILTYLYGHNDIVNLVQNIYTIVWVLLDYLWSVSLSKIEIVKLNCYTFVLYLILSLNNHWFYQFMFRIIYASKSIYVSYIIYAYDKEGFTVRMDETYSTSPKEPILLKKETVIHDII
jgi:hypothetical protein